MKLKYLGLAFGILSLVASIVLSTGCQNQPIEPSGRSR